MKFKFNLENASALLITTIDTDNITCGILFVFEDIISYVEAKNLYIKLYNSSKAFFDKRTFLEVFENVLQSKCISYYTVHLEGQVVLNYNKKYNVAELSDICK